MCGIAGLIGGERDVDCAVAMRMANSIRHRGPDDEGYVTLRNDGAIDCWGGKDSDPQLQLAMLDPSTCARVIFAHRRLSILDLSTAGHQPMCDETGRLWIVFNGEIYNYLELRRE